MTIIGHPAIAYPPFIKVSSLQEIAHTQAAQILWFDPMQCDKDTGYTLANHCCKYQVPYAVRVNNITDLLIYANLQAKYLIVHFEDSLQDAMQYQKIIEHYLLDCKLLYPIKNDAQIQKVAKCGIDGVIFKQVLGNI
ncbi:hypothetical protein LS68_007945 [Helicobacter sp. MIT 05-5293]|uniref:hypothetical protein n=1 Tax=Helicobacter sp. MIT 05-5293 TaxID=1548149 RepID=UPI00051CEBF7|nr:hypothetical protein [Helicobacter sp. MIT 05-5293]TLD80140.1 hypothetical protein LS68_007945 [Helicobacter sp. MIT 05-5293]